MAGVAIGRLRLRGPPALVPRTVFLLEDGCRTEIADDDRLILVRRLAIDRRLGSTDRRARAAAIRDAYAAATASARHGGSPDAASANCVWFAGWGEARRLLLALLLSGGSPRAWFWRLAVPAWQGGSWREWLVSSLRQDDPPAEAATIVAMLRQVVEAGEARSLIALFAKPAPSAALASPTSPVAAPRARQPGQAAAEALPAPDELLAILRQIDRHMAPDLRHILHLLVSHGPPDAPVVERLVRELLLHSVPALSLSPPLAARLVEAMLDRVRERPAWPDTAPSLTAPPASPAPGAEADPGDPPPDDHEAPPPAKPEARPALLRPDANTPAPSPHTPDPRPDSSPSHLDDAESFSAAAGLWLVIPSLIHMDFRGWLAERPGLLPDDPGRTLLRHIARHHRVTLDDPAHLPLAIDGEREEPRRSPDWARLWDKALDGWLRRRAGLRLSALVWRPGWLHLDEDRLVIRFRPDDADLRLRRHALDVDPGWTDWLGMVVRYRYAGSADR